MKLIGLAIGITLIFSAACTTPVEIKQALAAKDQAYVENMKLMGQYRELVTNVNIRHRHWYRYISTRLKLDLALQWSTTNPKVAGVSDSDVADDDFLLLGPDIAALINEIRLAGLPERKSSTGQVVFSAGKGDMNNLLQTLPELVSRVEKKVDLDSSLPSSVDMTAFEDYSKNVGALRRINAMIKGYLDIDVAMGQGDVQQLAEAIKKLR
jgi:hypothetical protein